MDVPPPPYELLITMSLSMRGFWACALLVSCALNISPAWVEAAVLVLRRYDDIKAYISELYPLNEPCSLPCAKERQRL